MKDLLDNLLRNPHTFGAGLAILVTVVICKLGPIWFPSHTAQFEQTDHLIFRLATGYGFLLQNMNKPKPEETK